MKLKGNSGLGLVELIIALSLLSMVLALGYTFYSFGTTSFASGEKQSNLQQAVALTADHINRELRYATEIAIDTTGSAVSVPNANAINDPYENYIFLNADNAIELRQQNSSRLLLDPATFGMNLESISFTRINHSTLAFTITGSRRGEPTRTFEIASELFAENLGLTGDEISVIPAGTKTVSGAVIFFRSGKQVISALPGEGLTIYPDTIPLEVTDAVEAVDPFTINPFTGRFTLTLTSGTFVENTLVPGNFELGGDFRNLTITPGSIVRSSDTTVNIAISGTLASDLVRTDGLGTITVRDAAWSGTTNLVGGVIVHSGFRNLTIKVRTSDALPYSVSGFVLPLPFVPPAGTFVDNTRTLIVGGNRYSFTGDAGDDPDSANVSINTDVLGSSPQGRFWQFARWEWQTHDNNTVTSEQQNLSVVMDDNKTITAVFRYRIPLRDIPGGLYVRWGGVDYQTLAGTTTTPRVGTNFVLETTIRQNTAGTSASWTWTWDQAAAELTRLRGLRTPSLGEREPTRAELGWVSTVNRSGEGWTDSLRIIRDTADNAVRYWANELDVNSRAIVTGTGTFGNVNPKAAGQASALRVAFNLETLAGGPLFFVEGSTGNGTRTNPLVLSQ